MANGSLVETFLTSVAAAGDRITMEDQALVDLGARYALQIDAGIDVGGQAATKALYLGPHLVNVCRELGLTPAARGEVGDDTPTTVVEDELSSLRRRHRGGA